MVGLWEHCSWLAGGHLLAVSSHSTGQRQEANSSVSSFYFILFIWLCQILFVACCLTRDWTPASGVQSLSHWTTREALSLLPRALISPRRLHFHDLMTSRKPGHHHSGHQSFNMWILRGHKYPQHLPKAPHWDKSILFTDSSAQLNSSADFLSSALLSGYFYILSN